VFDGEGTMNKQSQIMVLKGAPASAKSTFARELMNKEPGRWKRINNDAIREAVDFGVWSQENEKHIRALRKHLLQEFLRAGYDIIVDNVNGGKRNFDEICAQVSKMNIDCCVFEKAFYVPLPELIERDNKRTGNAKVGEKVVKRWFDELGGDMFRFYKPRSEVFTKRICALDRPWTPMEQNENNPKCSIFDLDGSMCLLNRNPYDPSTCINDTPHKHVVELCKLHYNTGHKIFFFSGREDKHIEMTRVWLDKYFGYPYELHMRETNNFEDDAKLKERMFNTHIKDKYNCVLWCDDRLRVCRFIHRAGLPLFRVGSPDNNF
jgi:predicted kinase